jgi:hypothetical protein
VSCRYPTGRARSTCTSCPSTPSATMFSAPPLRLRPLPLPTPFPYPLPQRHRPVPSGRSALLGRAGPAPPALRGRSGRTGPCECGIDTHCAESPCFIQSTESGEEMGPVGRMQSHGAAAGTHSEFAGSRRDILQDILQEMIQNILRGYPTGCMHHPHRISCNDISCRVS